MTYQVKMSGLCRARAATLAAVLLASMPFEIGMAVQGREEKFELSEHGVLVLPIPLGWGVQIERLGPDLPYNISIKPESVGDSSLVIVTPLWSTAGDPDFNSPANVKDVVRQRGEKALPSAVETRLTLQPVKGPEAEGYFFVVTDKAPKPGEYPIAIQGSVAVGELLLTATILTHDQDSGDVYAALGMLKGARHVPEPESADEPLWSPEQLQQQGSRLVNKFAGYSLTIPEGWTLRESSNPGSVHLEGPTGLSASIMLKEEALDADTEFKALELTLPFMGGRYRHLGTSTTRLSKERAIEILAERTDEGGRRWERTVGALHNGRFYILQADALWDAKKDLRTALKVLEKSFQFDPP